MDNIAQKPETETGLALATCLEDSFFETRRLRHDGWDGKKMAAFCGTLAETGIVTFACRAADMSAQSAYALRHRNPIFARAWEAALAMARDRLADELLARSLKGSHEALLRDGAIVAERQHYDNKLAFAVLRRLDRRAELGASFKTPPKWEQREPAPAIKGQWDALMEALADDRQDVADRLLTEPLAEVDSKIDDPRFSFDDSRRAHDSRGQSEHDDADDDASERVWRQWGSEEWRTDFPPPPGFDGDETGSWEEEGYSRSLTDQELAGLAAAGLADPPPEEVTIEEDECARDAFFASLTRPLTGEVEAAPAVGGGGP